MINFTFRLSHRHLNLCAASLFLAAMPALAADTPGGDYQWMPAEAVHGGLASSEGMAPRILLPVTITQTPKATADLSKYTRLYTIDLARFNIKNDGTRAEATTRGLNEALQDAKAQGANRIVFPRGTYLISEKESIILDHKDTVIDLNGATLQMNTNGQPHSVMVSIENGARNLRLTNGTLRGDRDTHDYQTIQGSHEGCVLLMFRSGRNLEADNLTIANAPGFAITTHVSGARNRAELLSMIPYTVDFKNLEQGGYSATGEKLADSTKTRSVKPYDASRIGDEFEFGYTAGYMGFPFIKDRNYQVLFYDAEMKFLEKRNVLQFRKVAVPRGAKFIHFEFNQGEVSTTPAHSGAANEGYCGRITTFQGPTDVHFHHNRVTNNRALGLAITGGQKWVIEENLWEGNGGQAPSYAIDYEDGWEMMQDIVLRKNTFKNNQNDLVVCAGSELLFEDNDFEKTVSFQARTYNYSVRNNRFIGNRVFYTTRTGVMKIHDNVYRDNPDIRLTFDRKGVADGLMRTGVEPVATPAITLSNESLENVRQITGTYLKIEKSRLKNVKLVAGEATLLADLRDNEMEDVSLLYQQKGPEVLFVTRNNKGELSESGPGLARKNNGNR